ncbi:MAG: hypothetical protein A3G20_06285 [Acidobacteria bacterium RIFCSPLOWO2_12_FULL_59_11]|nr:MAG: hypothetical protein A3G20_06285 [Acidobacteria bacterium RIFCSPLOWO2_12_FULL_59_11]
MNSRFPTRTAIVVVAAPAKTEAPVEAAPVAQKKDKPRLKGFGSLYKRGNLWWIGYSVNGRWFRESSGSESDTVALNLLKKRWKEVGKGRFIGPSEDKVRMDDLFEAVRVDYRNNARRSTKDLEGRIRNLEAAFAGMRAVDVAESLIERYKANRLSENIKKGKRKVCPATVNRELGVLRRAFRLAVRQKRISAAPNITLFEENNARQGFVEPKEFEAIASNLPKHLQDFCRFAYATGWRKGELQTLRWADVNRDAQTIILRSEHSKNKEPRLLPLTGELGEIVARRWAARVIQNVDGTTGLAEYVFHCGDGRPVGEFRKTWKAACKKAGKPGLLVHDLRRSAVRNFDRSGVSQTVAMKISGHKTDSVYRRYRIVSESDIREALERTQAVNAEIRQRKVVSIAEAKESSR